MNVVNHENLKRYALKKQKAKHGTPPFKNTSMLEF